MLQHDHFPTSGAGKYVELIDGKPTTTSMIIAKEFDKRHDHVLRDIRNLEIPEDFRLPNFGDVEIIEENAIGGKVVKKYFTVTRNGFMLLAMGFTGQKAMARKVAFIQQFDAMESALRQMAQQPPALPSPAPEPVQAVRLDRVLSVEEYVGLMRFKIQTLEQQAQHLEQQRQEALRAAQAPPVYQRARRTRKPLTASDRQEIIDLFNDGHSINAIANLTGRHRDTVTRVVNKSILEEDVPAAAGPNNRPMLDLSDVLEPGDAGFDGAKWRAA